MVYLLHKFKNLAQEGKCISFACRRESSDIYVRKIERIADFCIKYTSKFRDIIIKQRCKIKKQKKLIDHLEDTIYKYECIIEEMNGGK